MLFEVEKTYSRDDVQELLDVPESRRGGHWQNGYAKFNGELYIFCNVGAPGRTGHDYPNIWSGDNLVWVARNGAKHTEPLMREIASGDLPVHVFWRSDNANPKFTYRGIGRVALSEPTVPARFTFAFEAGGPATHSVTTLRKLLESGGRLYAKSEFGPVHDGWPAVSFSQHKIAADFSRGFRRGVDFLLFVGTTDPKSTKDPAHRSRVLCAATLEPNAPVSTNQIVPAAEWAEAVAEWGNRWEWSLPVTESYDFVPLLNAREIIPQTYAALGSMEARGRCIPVATGDFAGLLDQPLVRRVLALSENVSRVVTMNPNDPSIRKFLSQLAISIQQRIQNSDKERSSFYPTRKGPDLGPLIEALNAKWIDQHGKCSLCGNSIVLGSLNRLLQPSADRIDSQVKSYDVDNIHLTHMGCNLAKNDATIERWLEYLNMLRGVA